MKISAKFTVPLDKLVAQAQKKYQVDASAILRKLSLDLFAEIVRRTPVDTGRARANWNYSLHSPNFRTTTSTVPSVVDVPPSSLMKLPRVYISNGLSYVRELEYGRSDQAPQGFIRLSIQTITNKGV